MVINSTEHLTEGNNCGYFSAGDTRFCDFLDFVTVMPIPKCPIVIVALSDFVTTLSMFYKRRSSMETSLFLGSVS